MKKTEWNPTQESFDDYLERCWTHQIFQELHDICAYYRLHLPLPQITLNDDSSRLGSFDAHLYLISISRELIKNHSWDVVIEILKHELAHFLVFHQGGDDDAPHGAKFQKACLRLGVAPWARHATIEIEPQTAISNHRQLAAEEARLLQRVEKLLSLASSSNEHEAALAMQRARELCARHHLESLLAHKKTNYTYIVINHQKQQIPSYQWRILHILTEFFYVNSVSRSLFDAKHCVSHRVIDIMGSLENVQMAEYVYWFLHHQLPILFDQFRVKQKSSPRNIRNSFYLGVLRGFTEKLQAQQQDLKTRAEEWGLVASDEMRVGLERRSKIELENFVSHRYPRLCGGSSRSISISAEAFSSGKERGRELNLHRGLHESHNGTVHQLK